MENESEFEAVSYLLPWILEVLEQSNANEHPLHTNNNPFFDAARMRQFVSKYQTHAHVREAVRSLTVDPAVFAAVLKNERVQEVRAYLTSGDACQERGTTALASPAITDTRTSGFKSMVRILLPVLIGLLAITNVCLTTASYFPTPFKPIIFAAAGATRSALTAAVVANQSVNRNQMQAVPSLAAPSDSARGNQSTPPTAPSEPDASYDDTPAALYVALIFIIIIIVTRD